MVTGLMSASARLPKEIACGSGAAAGAGGGGLTRAGAGVGRGVGASTARGCGARAGGSSGRSNRPVWLESRMGAAAAARASANGAAAAAAVLSGVTGRASTLVRGMDCQTDAGASAAGSPMGSDAGAACLLRIRPSQPKRLRRRVVGSLDFACVFAFQVNCGLLEVLFALAGEDSGGGRHRLGLLGEIALLGLGEGALNAPILNPLVDPTNDGEVGFDPLAAQCGR